MKRLLMLAAVALVMVVTPGGSRAAADLPIAAFFGTFTGGGVAENRDSIYFAVTARDFDVVIRPEGAGFRIDWTSVIRRGGDPARPDIRRKKTTKILVPAGAPGVFRGTGSGDPLAGGELCWARIAGNTLKIFLMMVDKAGIYELQQYDRTLSGTGMQLIFTSLRDGDRVRTVKGRLVKTGN